jgi:hypothetical protein
MYLSNVVRSEGDPRVLHSGPSSLDTLDRAARLLGWFSFALGILELMAPRRLSRSLGMDGRENLVRAYGVREIGAGIATLSVDKQVGLWSRVAGDALDVLTLLPALSPQNPKRGNAALALTMVVGVTVLDIITAQATGARQRRKDGRWRDYSDRSGFPKGLPLARKAAGIAQQSETKHAAAQVLQSVQPSRDSIPRS